MNIDAWSEGVFAEVRDELSRARCLFPSAELTTVALTEEFGELIKAAMDESVFSVRLEAVQTITMCLRLLWDGDDHVNAHRANKGLEALGDAPRD
ncbi:MAG TPA: hypothetical protein VFJ01_05550 [Oleiagrimonas sp.]|nr:hypothetical protein [Oleiagrimonas sp.]